MDILTRTAALPRFIFSFGDSGYGLTFYALSYLIGAGLALLLSNWRASKDGYPSDFFVNLFLWAFPMGIIGGRIWYVIAEWDEYASNPWNVFAIWEGGLAIQGGAILGVLTGIVFVKIRRRGVPLLQACDWAVPTILVAQMIGRWGNFFNGEVFGNAVSVSAYPWLPGFIVNQLGYQLIGGDAVLQLSDSELFVPLFLIEGLLNIGGYFILTHGMEHVLRKWRVYGDEAFGYFVWYGVVRAVLEPLRYPDYNMNNGGSELEAEVMAFVFIGVGLALLIANHVFTKLREKGRIKYPSWLASFFDNGTDPKYLFAGKEE